jgi:hypothetical protein
MMRKGNVGNLTSFQIKFEHKIMIIDYLLEESNDTSLLNKIDATPATIFAKIILN